ncbi:MAG TPA: hypothetical protein VMS55_00575 [Myxococcota bacterium]|nr:hypothetical protein [Myxococcota bacterium]
MSRVGRVLFALLAATSAARASADEGTVWFWFATCSGPEMRIAVSLDSVTLYKSSFPICQAKRASASSQGQKAKVQFTFRPARDIEWHGYRTKATRTQEQQPLTCRLWQAGADPNDLLIGVGLDDANGIHMNTIHVAKRMERSRSEIARGLVIETYPAEDGKPSPK